MFGMLSAFKHPEEIQNVCYRIRSQKCERIALKEPHDPQVIFQRPKEFQWLKPGKLYRCITRWNRKEDLFRQNEDTKVCHHGAYPSDPVADELKYRVFTGREYRSEPPR